MPAARRVCPSPSRGRPALQPALCMQRRHCSSSRRGSSGPKICQTKRQKIQGDRPEALAEMAVPVGQQHAAGDPNSLIKNPPPIKTKPQPEQRQDIQPDEADDHIAQAMTSKVGKLGMEVIRDTLMCQQALFTEQVRSQEKLLHGPVCKYSSRCALLPAHV